ncbi:GEVED domain-containing protein [Rubripirellula reticaptiva]|uniref:Dockerin type I repeat protein n=1 Tax=Rubripirellula reticaptiva TaxID=2528013 RepID=A0A5C6F9W7_9BACT|nr:GEVED domain-containing protein [Rubripirellula reticaptiva]TWU58225.1 Dockerin type I repeat protein [Rubripirellula reticaptiva]
MTPSSHSRYRTKRRRFESLETRRLLTTVLTTWGSGISAEGESTANAQPSFVIANPVTVDEDLPLQTIADFATDFDPGPGEGDESTASQVIHDEGAGGTVNPMSADNTTPTNLGTLAIGSNIVRGTVESAKSVGNVDVFTFQIEPGFQLDGLFVLEYSYDEPPANSNERNAFLAINDTDSFPYDAFDLDFNINPFLDETAFIGGTVFGLDDLPDVGGASILRRAGVVTGSRFTPPLAAGTYTFYIQQTGPLNHYALDLRVTEITKQSVLAYHVTNVSDPSLFTTQPTIDVDGTLRFRSAANANGVATFDVSVQDNGGTENGGDDTSMISVGTITINAVNDPPTFNAVNPPSVLQNAGPQTVANFATDFVPGPDNESDQTIVRYSISNFDDPTFFDADPAIDASGTLTYAARTDLVGSVSFDVTVTDSGGGNDTSAPKRITITVDSPPILYDRGDAPETYPVMITDDGARHEIGDLFLGAGVSADADGQPSQAADTDDLDDGIRFITDIVAFGDGTYTGGVLVTASAAGVLDAWIDFNRDGDWDDLGEKFATSVSVLAGSTTVPVPVPSIAEVGETFARFRLSSAGGLAVTGSATDGEVEDYRITILDGASAPEIHVNLNASDDVVQVRDGVVVVESGSATILSSLVASVGSVVINDIDGNAVLLVDAQAPVVISSTSPSAVKMGAGQQIDGRFVRTIVDKNGTSLVSVETQQPWQNLVLVSDVNNSGDVSASDALRIINELGRREFSDGVTQDLDDPSTVLVWPDTYFDQNGDGRVTALDALRVINELARIRISSEPEILWIDHLMATSNWAFDDDLGDDDVVLSSIF